MSVHAPRIIRHAQAAILAALLPLVGCTAVGVRHADHANFSAEICSSITDDGKLSPWTTETLQHHDLQSAYQRTPAIALTRLQDMAAKHPEPDSVFALAEMSYALGHSAQRWEDKGAGRYYYLSAGYAYHYLFDGREHDPFDPRFRLACDFYNAALEQCLRTAMRADASHTDCLQVPLAGSGTSPVCVKQRGFSGNAHFGHCLFCDDFKVKGLANRHTAHGLGVPLICAHDENAPRPMHLFYPRGMCFPATAFLRFDSNVDDLRTERQCKGWLTSSQLELHNPITTQSLQIAGRTVPLETDLTAPLAYFVSRSDLDGIEYLAFVHADRLRDRTGIYMFEPYQPGKIPVLMVHGLLSNPLTWAAMYNDLRADPVLREKYQFWFYLYPSGTPWLAVAGDLRQNLADLRQELDPRHQDATLGQMVVVGHSMGGLVGKLLTVQSGDDFWNVASKQPLATLKVQPETRTELQRIFYFDSEPSVRRVIFIGTPHHGSQVSPSPIGKLAARVAQLPLAVRTAASEALQAESADGTDANKKSSIHPHVPNSVDFLVPGSPALELLAARSAPEGVHYHSIIGNKLFDDPVMSLLSGPHREPSDGIVAVRSARITGVDSELVIPADHEHVHLHPQAIHEVRRILLQHLQELDPIQRVRTNP